MVPSIRRLLVGPADARFRRSLDLLLAATLFVATFAAYAVGVFEVAGCVVLLPGQAALVGLLGGGLIGFRRGGLVFAWVAAAASLLGYHADHAFLGLSNRSLAARFVHLVEFDGLGFLAVEGIVIGTFGFVGGYLVVGGLDVLRARLATDSPE